MERRNKNNSSGCIEWGDQIPTILELPEDDDVRRLWEKHAVECPHCKEALETERLMHAGFNSLPDPGHAMVANRVMNTIKGKRFAANSFRPRDLVYGAVSSVVGVLLGIGLTFESAGIKTYTDTTPATYYEQIISNLENGPDAMVDHLYDELGN